MIYKYKPIGTKVLVKLLPEDSRQKPAPTIVTVSVHEIAAEVVSFGEGYITNGGYIPLLLTIGEKVLIQKSRGMFLNYTGLEYKLIEYGDILLRLPPS